MKKRKEKDIEKDEILNGEGIQDDDLFADDNKKKRKKNKIVLIVSIVLFLIIGGIIIGSSSLFLKKDNTQNDKNIDYLANTYGNDIIVSFLNKNKQKFSYKLCSRKISFCVPIQYDEKKDKWSYPNGESFVSVLLFMNSFTDILDSNGIEYNAYTDVATSNDIPKNLVLVIKKEDEAATVNAITSINNSNLIDNICGDGSDGCNANYHITIFNKDDYEIITSAIKKTTSIKNYTDLYEILFKYDDSVYGTRLGENIQRNKIDGNMFSCSDDDCSNHKHIAYRYVPGNHNYVGSTMIVEGIN